MKARYLAGAVALSALAWIAYRGRAPVAESAATRDARAAPIARDDVPAVAPESPELGRAAVVARDDEPAPQTTLRVSVVARSTHAPLEGAVVTLDTRQRPFEESQPTVSANPTRTTDSSGVVEYRDVPAEVELAVRAETILEPFGATTTELAPFVAGEAREVELVVPDQPDRPFWLRVLHDDDGRPVADARVAVIDCTPRRRATGEWYYPADERELATDEEGFVEVAGASWRGLELHVSAPSLSPAATPVVEGHATRAAAFVLRLATSATLSVRVIDTARSGLEGVEVHVHADTQDMSRHDLWMDFAERAALDRSARTGADGRARFEGLPADIELSLRARETAERWTKFRSALRLAPGEQREVELVFGGSAKILGRVLDEHGRPVADFDVWLAEYESTPGSRFDDCTESTARARSDADGRFAFEDVVPGEWVVGPPGCEEPRSPDPALIAPEGQPVSIGPYDSEIRVELVLTRGLYIRGRVEFADGAPAIGCSVRARSERPYGNLYAKTAADGSFFAGPLVPGEYVLTAGGIHSAFAPSSPVNVGAGTSDIVLRVTHAAAVDVRPFADGASTDAEVVLVRVDALDPLDYVMRAYSDDGFVRCAGLSAGAYSLYAQGRGGRVALLRVEVAEGEQRELDLELEPSARVRIENRSAGPVHVAPLVNGLALQPYETDGGTASTYDVPPGSLVARVLNAQGDELAVLIAVLGAGDAKTLVYPAE